MTVSDAVARAVASAPSRLDAAKPEAIFRDATRVVVAMPTGAEDDLMVAVVTEQAVEYVPFVAIIDELDAMEALTA